MRDTSYTPRDWWAGRQAKPVEAGDRTKWSAADLLRTTVIDYAKFIISIINNEHVTPEIARQRLIMARNDATQEKAAPVARTLQAPLTARLQPDLVLAGRSSRSTTT